MVDIIILISGNSKRMGQEKALLPFSENKSFVCQLIQTYLKLQKSNIFVLVNPKNENSIKQVCYKFKDQLTFVTNTEAEKGRHWSIITGLKQIEKGRAVFIQNIDNPFTSINILQAMLKDYRADSFLVPQFKGKNGHPLLLGSALVEEMKRDENSIVDLKSFLNKHEKRSLITQEETILANINTPEEYKKWFPNLFESII